MTFDLVERSRRLGQPIALLRLTRGALVERYCAQDRSVTIGAETFEPLAIERDAIRDSGQAAKGVLTVTLPIDAPCIDWWRPYPPSRTVLATWLAKHRTDSEAVIEWTGRVIGHKFTDSQLILSCEQSRSLARKRGQALRWQRVCPLALYSQGVGLCNVDKTLHDVPTTLDSADGVTLTAAAFAGLADGRLAGGFLEWTRPDGEPEWRSIMSHVGDTIVLNYGSDTLVEDLSVTAYKGCKHTPEDCDDEFDNLPNHGGAIYKPVRSPFDGNPP